MSFLQTCLRLGIISQNSPVAGRGCVIFLVAFLSADVDSRPPPIIHQGPQNQTLPVSSIAMLPCMASGEPAPVIRWQRNGRVLSLRDPRITILDSGTLQISGAELCRHFRMGLKGEGAKSRCLLFKTKLGAHLSIILIFDPIFLAHVHLPLLKLHYFCYSNYCSYWSIWRTVRSWEI